MVTTYFITGAEGVGKSSLIPLLKKELKNIDIHDFDEIGVPENPPLQWRLDTTIYWIKVALKNQIKGISTCIVGLCFPNEIEKYGEHKKLDCLSYCLLDLSDEEREKRLHKRNTPEMASYNTIKELRKEFEKTKHGKKIIDASYLSVEETAKKVIEWINKKEVENAN